MKWAVKTAVLVMVGLLFISIQAMADITSEIVAGSSVRRVISLYEPKGSTNYVGTLEWISAGGSGFFQRKDINGNVLNESLPFSSIVGSMDPVYDSQGKIANFKCFTGNTLKVGFVNYDANLVFKNVISSWSSPTVGEIIYPAGSVPFSDGTSLNVSYNTHGIYTMLTGADHKPLWTEMKPLDMSKLPGGWTNSTMTDLSVTKMDNGNIAIGFTGGTDTNKDTIVGTIDSDGNTLAMIRYDFGGLSGFDWFGDLESVGNELYLLSKSDAYVDLMYYLHLNENLGVEQLYTFSDSKLVPFDTSIGPDGKMYVAGGYGIYSSTGNGDGMCGWLDFLNPANNQFFIQDFGGRIDGSYKTVAWNPDGAIFGGSDHAGNAWRAVYTNPGNSNPTIPEPNTLILVGTGLMFLARVCRRKN